MRDLSNRAPQMCNYTMLHLLLKEALYLCRQAESQRIRSAYRLGILSGGLQSCRPGFAGDCIRARHAVRARCSCLWCRTTPHHGFPGRLRWRDVGQFCFCKPAAFLQFMHMAMACSDTGPCQALCAQCIVGHVLANCNRWSHSPLILWTHGPL